MASGPFAALRDARGTVVLAWGAAAINARARELGFDVLVLAANGIQDPGGRLEAALGIPVVRCGYEDTRDLAQAQAAVLRCGPVLARHLEDGHRVLVTCAAGENRSALLAAYARHLLTGEPGSVIYADMERSGPQGFSNNVFRRWVLTWPQETGRQAIGAWTKGVAIVGGMVAGALLVRLLVPW